MSSFRHTMLVHLGEVPADHEWRSGFGTPLRTQLAKFACDTEQADAMRATFVEYSDKHHDRMVEVYPGVREALENLCAREAVRLAIVTSKNRRGTRRGLPLCGLEQYFDVFVSEQKQIDNNMIFGTPFIAFSKQHRLLHIFPKGS